ncbi:MAG: hypothetical protein KAI24_14815 [Planctomycetes bacterium]|nr:hypothetical protein [Planctomycetota bacterium]
MGDAASPGQERDDDAPPEVRALANLDPSIPLANGEAALAPVLDRLQQAITVANDASSLKHLNDQLALAREWARRMRLAFDGQNRFAELELRSARRLGQILGETVKPGRPAKRSKGSTVSSGGLPDGITRDRSSKCQRIAAIEPEAFERFLEDCKRQGLLISEGRLLRTFYPTRSRSSPKPRADATHPRPRDVRASARIVEATQRLFAVDVVVGEPQDAITDAEVVPPDGLRSEHLRGNMFFATCPDPRKWLPKLVSYREQGRFAQAVVTLPAAPGAPWFRNLERGGWTCCFEDEGEVAVLYIGPRRHGFWVAFHDIGTILHGSAVEPDTRGSWA